MVFSGPDAYTCSHTLSSGVAGNMVSRKEWALRDAIFRIQGKTQIAICIASVWRIKMLLIGEKIDARVEAVPKELQNIDKG